MILSSCNCCLSPPKYFLTLECRHRHGCVHPLGGLTARATALAVLLIYSIALDHLLQSDAVLVKFVPSPVCALLQTRNCFYLPYVLNQSVYEDHRIWQDLLAAKSTSISAVEVVVASVQETLNGMDYRCQTVISASAVSFVHQEFHQQYPPVAAE